MNYDELDFMSDDILEMVEKESQSSLPYSRKRKRTDIKDKHDAPPEYKSIKEQASEPLGKGNIGFRLLSRMGYQPGKPLGIRGEGVTEPLDLIIKSDRKGLGMKEEETEKLEAQKNDYEANKQLLEEEKQMLQRNYQNRVLTNMTERKLNQSLWDAVKVSRSLDETSGVQNPLLSKLEEYEKKEINPLKLYMDELLVEDIEIRKGFLAALLDYLRMQHYYCIFCGAQYGNVEELNELCPGFNEEDHE